MNRTLKDSVFCHCTSNNTIFGTQWKIFPDVGWIPLVCDMSSDILSRKVDWGLLGLVYASAQKSLWPAGVTVVVIRNDLMEKSAADLPDILSYRVMADKNSLYNTPGCFSTYMMHKVLKWVESRSVMNVTFNLTSEDPEAKFVADAKAEGIIGIKGHRSVSGIRVSIYNSHDEKDTEAMASFIKRFIEKNG